MVIAFTTLLLIIFNFSNFSSYPVFVCFLQLSDLFFTLNSFHLIFVVQFFILLALLAILFRDRPDPVAVPLTDLNRYVKFFDFLF
jgi:hypothetical protein